MKILLRNCSIKVNKECLRQKMQDSRGVRQVSFSLAMAIERLKKGGDGGGRIDKSTKMLDYARSYRPGSYGAQLYAPYSVVLSSITYYNVDVYAYIYLFLYKNRYHLRGNPALLYRHYIVYNTKLCQV